MNLLDKVVDEIFRTFSGLSSLRPIVEKELLHHDILRIMNEHGFLKELTFMGGSCLRHCYGGARLSEDLDFTGGQNFDTSMLSTMGEMLESVIREKYGFEIIVNPPKQDINPVSTWKIKIDTRPKSRRFPSQRINIDICAVNSYERRPAILSNGYGLRMETHGLIIQVQTREEIYADKILAFVLRPNRIKYRDLWDIVWLHQSGLKPRLELIPKKLQERNLTISHFMEIFASRCQSLSDDNDLAIAFEKEMKRFLPPVIQDLDQLWSCIIFLMEDLERQMTLMKW